MVRIRLRGQGPGEITAGMIDGGADLEIMNPDLVICTLDDGAVLSMEITVDHGKGYRPAAINRPEDAPIGLIPVDSLFSPINTISYQVENTRVGQQTDYDKLTMQVDTNGAVNPEDALALAARVLQDQLQLRRQRDMHNRGDAVAAHPGLVWTPMMRGYFGERLSRRLKPIARRLFRSPEEGAGPVLHACCHAEPPPDLPPYFVDDGLRPRRARGPRTSRCRISARKIRGRARRNKRDHCRRRQKSVRLARGFFSI